MTLCSGSTKKNTACKNLVRAGTIYCRHHCTQKENVTGNVKEKIKRVNCDSNAYELIFTLILAGVSGIIHLAKNIDEITELVDHLVTADYPNVIINKKENYIKSFLKINRCIAAQYIERLLELLPSDKFSRILLCGKSQIPEIKELNRGIELSERKADVYGCTEDGKYSGFSAKQDTKCTKTNLSVEKLTDQTDTLCSVRKKYLESNGHPKYEKHKRENMNDLFRDPNNTYFTQLRKAISENKSKIIAKLYSLLYRSTLPYPLYEFDGKSLINMSDISVCDASFEEHEPYYYKKNGERRCAAKMFYRLQINLTVFRVEIRWKGNVFYSPQFHTHLE